jgi:hypothetical protein
MVWFYEIAAALHQNIIFNFLLFFNHTRGAPAGKTFNSYIDIYGSVPEF